MSDTGRWWLLALVRTAPVGVHIAACPAGASALLLHSRKHCLTPLITLLRCPFPDEDDELPFACFICRRVWAEAQDPVVTKCRHYFCEQCALQHNAKSSKCFVCEQPTGGIFNVAHDILRREKARQRKEAGGG